MLLFKLCITPLLMGVATLVARRWGPVVGGIFTALPLTAGPVSAFLYLEQGPEFARNAAGAGMLGYAALGCFILVFVWTARHGFGCVAACLCSAVTYFGAAWLFSHLPRHGLLLMAFSVLVLALVFRFIPGSSQHWTPPKVRWWDLPLRMVLAGGMVLGVTALAALIGPQWSGVLSTYPVFITLMAVFTLVQSGEQALCQLMRGFVGGLVGSVIFFFVLQWALPLMHAALAYTVAAVVNLLVCGVDLWLTSHPLRLLQRHLRDKER